MTIVLALLPAALALGLVWLAVFTWCLRADQFADMEGAARRILEDDKPADDPRP